MDALIEHAFDLLKNDSTERISDENTIYKKLGITEDEKDKATRVREQVHEMYIKDRKIALDAIEEGLTMNGEWMLVDVIMMQRNTTNYSYFPSMRFRYNERDLMFPMHAIGGG